MEVSREDKALLAGVASAIVVTLSLYMILELRMELSTLGGVISGVFMGLIVNKFSK